METATDDDYDTRVKEYAERRLQLPEQLQQDHPLEHTWVLYWFTATSERWLDCFSNVATIDCVEDFFVLMRKLIPPSKMRNGTDYWLFKKGIEPQWEDPKNIKGGRWLIQFPPGGVARRDGTLDKCWDILTQLVVGENFGVHSKLVSGAVVQLKGKADKIALWTQDCDDLEGNRHIGNVMKDEMKLDFPIQYEAHSDAQAKRGSRIMARIEL